jgi:hypothetical protein
MPRRDALDASTSGVRLARSTRVREHANRAARAASTAREKKPRRVFKRARVGDRPRARRAPRRAAPRRAARGREK